jgi:hypothetical protein
MLPRQKPNISQYRADNLVDTEIGTHMKLLNYYCNFSVDFNFILTFFNLQEKYEYQGPR